MKSMNNHEYWMKQAIELAKKSIGRTAPNPVVGAIVVKAGKKMGQGYHKRAGGPHAEVLDLVEQHRDRLTRALREVVARSEKHYE